MAEWDNGCVVFLLKRVKIETENTRKHISLFFIATFLGWSEVTNTNKYDRKLQMCLTSAGDWDQEKRQDGDRQ